MLCHCCQENFITSLFIHRKMNCNYFKKTCLILSCLKLCLFEASCLHYLDNFLMTRKKIGFVSCYCVVFFMDLFCSFLSLEFCFYNIVFPAYDWPKFTCDSYLNGAHSLTGTTLPTLSFSCGVCSFLDHCIKLTTCTAIYLYKLHYFSALSHVVCEVSCILVSISEIWF